MAYRRMMMNRVLHEVTMERKTRGGVRAQNASAAEAILNCASCRSRSRSIVAQPIAPAGSSFPLTSTRTTCLEFASWVYANENALLKENGLSHWCSYCVASAAGPRRSLVDQTDNKHWPRSRRDSALHCPRQVCTTLRACFI